jgi:hypothetical protein
VGDVEVMLAGGHEVVALPDGDTLEAAALRLVATYFQPLRIDLAVVHTGRKADARHRLDHDDLDRAFTVTCEDKDVARELFDDAELRGRIIALLGQKKRQARLDAVTLELVLRDADHARGLVDSAIDLIARLGTRARALGLTIS